jgi:hypothetical protein
VKKLSLVIALLSVTVGALTQSSISNVYSRLGIGLLEQPGNVNSLGMGGISTVSFDNNALNLFNPASYSHLSRTVLQLTGKGIQSSLNNGESTTRYRGGQIQEIGLGLKKTGSPWGFAMGVTPYSAVGFNLTSTGVVNDSTTVKYKNDGTGGINRFVVGVSRSFKLYKNLAQDTTLRGTARFNSDNRWKEIKDSLELVSPKLSVGLNINYLFGSVRNERKVEYNNTRYFGTRITSRTTISDVLLEAGAHYYMPLKLTWDQKKIKSGTYLMLAADYMMGSDLNSTFDELGELYLYANARETVVDTSYQILEQSGTFAIPQRISLGAGIMHVGTEGRLWQYSAEYRVQDWTSFESTFSDALGVESLSKYQHLGFGIELTPKGSENANNLFERTTYRIGARNTDTYVTLSETQINQRAISAGFSMPILASRSSSKFNFGIEYGTSGTLEGDLIKENFVNFQIGLSLTPYFLNPWFVQRQYD